MPSSHVFVTADDQGPIANIVTWLCVAGAGCIVAAKIITKVTRFRRLNSDDLASLAALALNIGCAVATATQVHSGLGRHQDTLTTAQVASFEEAEYALQLLLVTSLMLSKLSTLQFLSTLAVDPHNLRLIRSVKIYTAVWTFVCILVVAFQCDLPRPWQFTGTCIRTDVFWDFYAAVESLIYMLLFFIPVILVMDLSIGLRKKLQVSAAFAGNLAVLPPIIIRSVYLDSATGAPDIPWNYFRPVILTQVTVNVALAAASVTFVKPFLDSIYTGLLSADVRQLSVSEGTLLSRRARLMHMLDAVKARPPPARQASDCDTMTLYALRSPPPNPVMVDFLNAQRVEAEAHADGTPAAVEEAGPSTSTLGPQENSAIIKKNVDIEVYES